MFDDCLNFIKRLNSVNGYLLSQRLQIWWLTKDMEVLKKGKFLNILWLLGQNVCEMGCECEYHYSIYNMPKQPFSFLVIKVTGHDVK